MNGTACRSGIRPHIPHRESRAPEHGIQIHGDIAITMGNVWVTDQDGNETMVDKTFVFKKDDDGKLKLIVHKSALPYSPEK